jgi:hypothetical protein
MKTQFFKKVPEFLSEICFLPIKFPFWQDLSQSCNNPELLSSKP